MHPMFENPDKICIITDLDGTFLPKSKTPLPRDLAAVRRFEQAGGVFTIATGRTVEASRRYPQELGLKSPMIVFNGAGIYDPAADRLVYIHPLPKEAADMTARVLTEQPHAGIEILCPASTWVINNTPLKLDLFPTAVNKGGDPIPGITLTSKKTIESNLNGGNPTDLEIVLEKNADVDLKKVLFDGITFKVKATSVDAKTLNKTKHTLKIEDLKVQVNSEISINPDKKD